MADKHFYFRATIDFTVFDDQAARLLRSELGSSITNERLGHYLGAKIEDGKVEIDAISDIEDHGSNEDS